MAQLTGVPDRPGPQVVGEDDHVGEGRLAERVAAEGHRLREDGAEPVVDDRSDDDDGCRQLRSLPRQLDHPLGSHRMADQHGPRYAEALESDAETVRHDLDREVLVRLGQPPETREVDRVHLRMRRQRVVQRHRVAVRDADPVHDHVGRGRRTRRPRRRIEAERAAVDGHRSGRGGRSGRGAHSAHSASGAPWPRAAPPPAGAEHIARDFTSGGPLERGRAFARVKWTS